jgi:hypothetical protein
LEGLLSERAGHSHRDRPLRSRPILWVAAVFLLLGCALSILVLVAYLTP